MGEFLDIKESKLPFSTNDVKPKNFGEIKSALEKSGIDELEAAQMVKEKIESIAKGINEKMDGRKLTIKNLSISDNEMVQKLVDTAEKDIKEAILSVGEKANNKTALLAQSLDKINPKINNLSFADASLRDEGSVILTPGNSRIKRGDNI
ncbi:hypothetical protein H3C61_02650 [Candidatus Gracilibacteria bacterium]|nr:hypothetical protein [Candidatus Gracilibacteria bacterium]